jgi:hypothetical protein
MGRRDIRAREPKKAKKDAKKVSQVNILTTPPPVEVIKKARKKKSEEEE